MQQMSPVKMQYFILCEKKFEQNLNSRGHSEKLL